MRELFQKHTTRSGPRRQFWPLRMFAAMLVCVFAASAMFTAPVAASTEVGWSQEGPSLGDRATVALSADGLRMAVGDRFFATAAGEDVGRVQVFDWNGSSWTQAGTDLIGERRYGRFGVTLDLSADGSRLVVGEPGDQSQGGLPGSAVTYDWSGTGWVQVVDVIESEVLEEQLGGQVSISDDGSRVAVTSWRELYVKVFDLQGTAWTQVGSTLAGQGGGVLSGDGSRLILTERDGENPIVSVREWNGTAWVQVGSDLTSPVSSESFGVALDIASDGTRIAIGSTSGNFVAVYDLVNSDWTLAGDPIVARGFLFGWAVALSADGSRLAVFHASDEDEEQNVRQLTRVFDWAGSSWQEAGYIDGQASGGWFFLDSVAMSSDGSRIAHGPNAAVYVPGLTCGGLAPTIDMNTNGGNGTGTAGDDVILGTPGEDVIDAGAGNDTVCAGAGDDTVVGGSGDDTMFGEGGRDIMRGNAGVDMLDGGDGDDRLLGGIDGDTLIGGEGDDYLGGFGGADTIDGGPGDETIFGGFGADTIDGGDGNDTIAGLIGNDVIDGGAGNDTLNGDRGQDTINGGDGDDLIKGGNGDDILSGDAGDDSVNGGRADDQLSGGAGTGDTCVGNKENVADTADATCETIFGVP